MYGQADFVEARQRGGNFGHLHQADGAFHHARAAGAGDDDQRHLAVDGALDGARDFFADDGAHRAADEIEFHRAAHDRAAVEQAFGGEQGVGHAQLAAGFLEAVGVGLGVLELQRIVGGELGVVLDPVAVEQHLDALARVQAEMVLALGADAQVALEVFLPDDGAAGTHLVHRPSVLTRRSSGGVG